MLPAQIKSYLKFKIQQKFDLQNQNLSVNEEKKQKNKKTVSKQNPKKGKKQGLKNSTLN